VLGVVGTAFVAAVDEIHQSFDPARTSRWQDVVLDTTRAVVLQLILFPAWNFGRAGRWFERDEA
jgi:VanZ family protein